MDTSLEERTILSCFYQKPYYILEFIDKYGLSYSDFSVPNCYIFRALYELVQNDSPVDFKTITERISRYYQNDDYDLEQLNSEFNIQDVEGFCRRLKFISVKNKLYTLFANLGKQIQDHPVDDTLTNINDLILETYNNIFDLLRDPNERLLTISDIAQQLYSYLQDTGQDKIYTGFMLYDVMIGGGLRPGSINLIEARAGIGKSLMALNIATNVAVCKIPVLILDSELNEKGLLLRLLSLLSGIPMRLLENGTFVNQPNVKIYLDYILYEVIPKIPITYKYIGGTPLTQIMSICKRFATDHKNIPKLIVYDYLHISTYDDYTGGLNETQIIGVMLNKLHDLVVRYDMPMLLISQSNREAINRIGSGTTAASDRYEWKASSKATLVEPKEEGVKRIHREIYITKSRFGVVSDDPILLKAHLATAKLVEYPYSEQPLFQKGIVSEV